MSRLEMMNNENRNCGCMNKIEPNCPCMGNNLEACDCNYTPQGINAAFGYNTMAMQDNDSNCGCSDNKEQCCCERNRIREEMIGQIKCLNFAIIELGLYLNTHSDDQRALCLHKEYCRQLKELKDKYQKVYGPLSIYYPCNKWRWLEEPWASFILGENGYLSTVLIKRRKRIFIKLLILLMKYNRNNIIFTLSFRIL